MKLIQNGWVITLNQRQPLLEDGAVAVEGDKIAAVGSREELLQQYPQAEKVDARGGIIMPGMLNTHMHLYSALARGMPLEGYAPKQFTDILRGLWWKLDRVLDREAIYYSALAAGIEAIKNGTTTLIDHHASPGTVDGVLDHLAEGLVKLGLRANLCYEVSDRDGALIARAGIAENVRFARWCQENKPPLLSASFGLHASFTLSDATLQQCVEQGAGLGFHVHTAEAESDRRHSLESHGLPPVQRLDKLGVWNRRSLAVHCVHIDNREMDILRERGSCVIHNPQSNMGNAVGRADVAAMVGKGLQVGLGSDGFSTDMFEGIRTATLLHRHGSGDPAAGSEVQQLAFVHNPEIASRMTGVKTGRLRPGWQADIIISSYRPCTPLTSANWFSHVLMGMSGAMVDTTMVAGKVLMEKRQLKTADEEQILHHARQAAARLWQWI